MRLHVGLSPCFPFQLDYGMLCEIGLRSDITDPSHTAVALAATVLLHPYTSLGFAVGFRGVCPGPHWLLCGVFLRLPLG